MYTRIIQTTLIIGVAIMVALIAEGAMLLFTPTTPDLATITPDIPHTEPTGPIAAIRMLVTLLQTTIVATIIVKVRQHNQQKRRIHKQLFSH